MNDNMNVQGDENQKNINKDDLQTNEFGVKGF